MAAEPSCLASSAGGNDGAESFLIRELDLVLDDAAEPRMFVGYQSDGNELVRKARDLAAFLGVPLLATPDDQK